MNDVNIQQKSIEFKSVLKSGWISLLVMSCLQTLSLILMIVFAVMHANKGSSATDSDITYILIAVAVFIILLIAFAIWTAVIFKRINKTAIENNLNMFKITSVGLHVQRVFVTLGFIYFWIMFFATLTWYKKANHIVERSDAIDKYTSRTV